MIITITSTVMITADTATTTANTLPRTDVADETESTGIVSKK